MKHADDFFVELLEPDPQVRRGKRWRVALDSAIQSRNESAIWKIIQGANNPGDVQTALADMASRMAYMVPAGPHYCELYMLPVIETDTESAILDQHEVWLASQDLVRETVERWFAPSTSVMLFPIVTSWSQVASWTPNVLRHHLQMLAPASERTQITFEAKEIPLPLGAPRLGFVTIGCTRKGAWPKAPSVDAKVDERFTRVLSLALHMAGGGIDYQRAPIVMTPDRMQHAIADGVGKWLLALDQQIGISGYVVNQSKESSDALEVVMQLDSEDVPTTQFSLRASQLGHQGLQDILTVLQATAPRVDRPMDSTEQAPMHP